MILAVLLFFLCVLSWQDYKEQKVYNMIPIIGCIIGLICNYLVGNFNNAFIGLCFGFVVLYVAYFAILKIKKIEAIGFGDVLASAMTGAFLGLSETYLSLCFGFCLGFLFCSLFKKKKVALIPFFTFGVIITQILGAFYEIHVFDFS